MDKKRLREWMFHMGLNKSQAALAFGIARSTLDRYLTGNPIPKYIKLSADALSREAYEGSKVPFSQNR